MGASRTATLSPLVQRISSGITSKLHIPAYAASLFASHSVRWRARSNRSLRETGRYLIEDVALCCSCHTERSQMAGAFTGPRFGGTKDYTEESDLTHSWAPPNITSAKETGRLGIITEDQFVARFRQGGVLPGSPMPWTAYSHLQEVDLRAISMYLKSVPPVKRDNGPVMVPLKKG